MPLSTGPPVTHSGRWPDVSGGTKGEEDQGAQEE